MYESYQLEQLSQFIYANQPTYQNFTQTSQLVDSWTVPPNNIGLLKQRYQTRSLLPYLSAQVQSEALFYLQNNPQISQYVNNSQTYLFDRALQNWNTPAINNWYSGWFDRFEVTYAAAVEPVVESLEEILNILPQFEDYLELRNEVISLFPVINNDPIVTEFSNLTDQVLSDPAISAAINSYYQQYISDVNELLSSTNYDAELERFYERVNGLLKGNATYQALEQGQYQAVLALDNYQQQLSRIVASGYSQFGANYSPYLDQNVLNLLPQSNQQTASWISTAASFYELYNQFWYAFYTSPSYENLAASTQVALDREIQAIQPGIEFAQTNYTRQVNSIPLIRDLRTLEIEVGNYIREQYPALDQRLEQMEEIASDLLGQTVMDVNDDGFTTFASLQSAPQVNEVEGSDDLLQATNLTLGISSHEPFVSLVDIVGDVISGDMGPTPILDNTNTFLVDALLPA